MPDNILELTRQVVESFATRNKIPPQQLSYVLEDVAQAFSECQSAPLPPVPVKQKPAVKISESVHNDYIVCLEDGKQLLMLKRYLRTQYGLSPEQYREKWNLPFDYPMICPAYKQIRSDSAKENGFGTKVRRRRR